MVADLHPDELMWRAARGPLSGAERADLTAHLDRCPACALECAVQAEAAAARAPSESDHGLAVRLVDRALSNRRPRDVTLHRTAREWKRGAARAALVLAMLTSAAVGASAFVARIHTQRTAAPEAGAETPAPARARRRHAVVAASPENETPPAAQAVPEPLPDPEPAAALASPPRESQPASPSIPPPSLGGGRAMRLPPAARTTSAPRAQAAPADDTQPPALSGADAATLLARAEVARAGRRFNEASGLYQELARRFPGARETVIARVLDGELLLDNLNDPAGALARFERYLANEPTGTLAEEARVGRARALASLDRRDDERAAWLDLLARHPRSVHASLARARLAALGRP